MARYYTPLDPNCPAVMDYEGLLYSDPIGNVMGAPLDEMMEDFERRHRMRCKRCQEYGAANIQIGD